MEDNNLEQHAGVFAHQRRLKPEGCFYRRWRCPEEPSKETGRHHGNGTLHICQDADGGEGGAEMERSTSFLNLLPDGGDYEKATKISEGLFSNKKTQVSSD